MYLHWCIRECICVRIGQSYMHLFSSKFFYMAFWAFGKFIAIRPKKHKGRCNSRQLAQHALAFSLPADPVSDSSEGKAEMSWGLKKWGPLKSDWTQVLGWERCFHCGSAGWQFSFFFECWKARNMSGWGASVISFNRTLTFKRLLTHRHSTEN